VSLGACTAEGCGDVAIVAMDEGRFCRGHFLAHSYQVLGTLATQMDRPEFHAEHGDSVARQLEECMRRAAEIACLPVSPGNLERAQVLDVLLWASELHGKLRRGPRVPVRMPILLKSSGPGEPWEEVTESQMLSLHGMQIASQHPLRVRDILTCMRLDNRRQTMARVVWTRPLASGMTEAGLEFTGGEDFWGLAPFEVASRSKS
jgi:hypothetical protein